MMQQIFTFFEYFSDLSLARPWFSFSILQKFGQVLDFQAYQVQPETITDPKKNESRGVLPPHMLTQPNEVLIIIY